MISFDITKAEGEVISAILNRVKKHSPRFKNKIDLAMDLTAVVASGYPIDLNQLLASDDLDFAVDLVAILTTLDRQTGKLPRGVHLRSMRREQ